MDLSALFQENQELLIALGVLVFLCLVFLLLSIRLILVDRRFKRLMKGSSGKNIEAVLQEAIESNRAVERRLAELDGLCEKLQDAASESLRNVGLLRFNAFPSMGGNLSFALALLDAQGNGVVLCSLVGRDDCRIYAKDVVRGKSSHPLSNEEKLAIKRALHEES
ncbi:MAG TPA: DUF4446 family protein [Syntrophomonadaceae bacterium]|nr:DUF4446 family protein [Syntrophomonadaceae bacterium]